jgi:hypothetical protein
MGGLHCANLRSLQRANVPQISHIERISGPGLELEPRNGGSNHSGESKWHGVRDVPTSIRPEFVRAAIDTAGVSLEFHLREVQSAYGV